MAGNQDSRRYVVGTSWGELAADPYEGTPEIFTDLAAAHKEADARNATGWVPGPDGTLVLASAWKVYELTECPPAGPAAH